MIKIAITAGGTAENIDGVRKITNVSTGSLGWNCLESALEYMQKKAQTDFHVFYILTETAVRKNLPKDQEKYVTFIHVTDAESVYKAVEKLVTENEMDYFIHSMAISDFTFSYAISMYELAQELSDLQRMERTTDADIHMMLEDPQNKFKKGEKISSDEDIILGLKRTKKVIPLIKKHNKSTVLVGFKLLRDVGENDLMKEASLLTEKNECDMVFANEVSKIGEKNHTGILIKNGKIIARPEGKKQIAEEIVKNMTS